jgi:flagellar P-ring protein precursor FlgI
MRFENTGFGKRQFNQLAFPRKMRGKTTAKLLVGLLFTFLASPHPARADGEAHKVLIRDVATVEGVRDNSLIGYGLVVGLKGTGDKQQTFFTVQTLSSILARMGVEIPASVLQSTVQVKNVAAVFVTATLPPFEQPGKHLDVTVSSAGDARSLESGLLLLTPLYAADGHLLRWQLFPHAWRRRVLTTTTISAARPSPGHWRPAEGSVSAP